MDLTALMSVYNEEEFIEEALESILNQTYSDFELLIVDDASTDRTVEIIKSKRDKRIKLITLDENVGVGAALNIGLRHINTKYVAKVDADDIYTLDRFEKQKEFLDNNQDVHLVKSLVEYFPDNEEVKNSERFKFFKNVSEKLNNSVQTPDEIKKYLNYWFCITHTCIMMRTDTLKKVGYRNLRLGEDYTLFYTLNKLGYKMDTVKENLVKIRVRKNSVTANSKGQDERFHYLYELKYEKIKEFLSSDNEIYIWGTGTLAKAFYDKFKSDNDKVKVLGFIDGRLIENSKELFRGLPIYSKDILQKEKKKVILAAKPAIFIARKYLESIDYKLGQDYFIYY